MFFETRAPHHVNVIGWVVLLLSISPRTYLANRVFRVSYLNDVRTYKGRLYP